MRRLIALCVFACAMAATTPALAVTIAAWQGAPVTVGDKSFTFISTTFATNTNVTFSKVSDVLYVCSLAPVSPNNQITSTTKSLVYKVTIVDDPGTSFNDPLLLYFTSVSGDGNRFIASGSFTASGTFDDNSDFLSPLTTFSNTGTPWGPNAVSGEPRELYVRLTLTASGGTTILTSYSVTFAQVSLVVPTQPTSWGRIKAAYR
jgi:hypothetical protein